MLHDKPVKKKSPMGCFQGVSGAIILAVVVILFSVFAVLPVEINKSGLVEQIIFMILGLVPIVLTSLSAWFNYVKPLFNNDPADDALVQLESVILTHACWVLSWAPIFQAFWVWQSDTWTGLDDDTNAYDVWIRMVSTSFLVATGTGFGPQVPGNWGALLMNGALGYSSWVVGAFIIASSLEVIRERIPKTEPPASVVETAPISSKLNYRYNSQNQMNLMKNIPSGDNLHLVFEA